MLWEPLSGRQLVQANERGVEFSRDGRWLASAVPGVVSGRWELSAPREHFTLTGHLRDPFVYDVEFHPQVRLLASVAGAEGVLLWDVEHGREVARFDSAGNSASFSRDGKWLMVGGQAKETHRIPLTMTTQQDVLQVHLGVPQRLFIKGSTVANVSFSADGRTLATSVDPATVVVAAVDGSRRVEIRGNGLRFPDFSPDGTLIAVGNWDGSDCGVYDATSGALVKTLFDSGSARVCFSPDGRTLACSRYDECTLWDIKSWTVRYRVPHGGSSYGVAAFSGDGHLAAVTTPMW